MRNETETKKKKHIPSQTDVSDVLLLALVLVVLAGCCGFKKDRTPSKVKELTTDDAWFPTTGGGFLFKNKKLNFVKSIDKPFFNKNINWFIMVYSKLLDKP